MESMIPRTAANWLCASTTLTLLLLATSCTGIKLSCRQRLDDTVHLDTINLGSAAEFTVLAYATVTNTGPTSIGGLVGVSPGVAIPGGSEILFKTLPAVHGFADTTTAAGAKVAVTAAYVEASLRTAGVVGLGGGMVNIGGRIFTPGLYKCTGALVVAAGEVILSGRGVYIFLAEETLEMTTGTKMVLRNGARASDIFWRLGSAATFRVGSQVKGTVLAYSSITAFTGVKVEGRLFALNEAITLDNNVIDFPLPF